MSLIDTFIGTSIINKQDADSRERYYRDGQDKIKDSKLRDQEDALMRQNGRIADLERERGAVPIQDNSELERVTAELEKYKSLLSKPMLEIAMQSGEFEKTYRMQQAIMAQNIIQEKSFRELAMKFGRQLGKTPEEVVKESEVVREKIITNQSEFNNNVDSKVKKELVEGEKDLEEARLENFRKEEKGREILAILEKGKKERERLHNSK